MDEVIEPKLGEVQPSNAIVDHVMSVLATDAKASKMVWLKLRGMYESGRYTLQNEQDSSSCV